MNNVNFCAKINDARATKVKVYLARKDKTKTDLMNHVIDNIEKLRPALDSTTHNSRKK